MIHSVLVSTNSNEEIVFSLVPRQRLVSKEGTRFLRRSIWSMEKEQTPRRKRGGLEIQPLWKFLD